MSRVEFGRNKIARLVSLASDFLRREGRASVARVAASLGYRSPEYFRRSVMPLIVELNDCIAYDPLDKELVWVCKEENKARG